MGKKGFVEIRVKTKLSGFIIPTTDYTTEVVPAEIKAETDDHYIVQLYPRSVFSIHDYKKVKKSEFIPEMEKSEDGE